MRLFFGLILVFILYYIGIIIFTSTIAITENEMNNFDLPFIQSLSFCKPEGPAKSAFSTKQVVYYKCKSIPSPLNEKVSFIEFPNNLSPYSYISIQFNKNPGKVNSTIVHKISEFIMSRPDWKGNISQNSLKSQIYMAWLENYMREDYVLAHFYPFYLSICKNNATYSLFPLNIQCNYQEKTYQSNLYVEENLPPDIAETVQKIVFETNNRSESQAYVSFHGNSGMANWMTSQKIARFIMENQYWRGDRTPLSIMTEIYLHWLAENFRSLFNSNDALNAIYTQFVIGIEDKRISPVQPIHLGYYYEGLNKTPIMDPLLKIL